MGETARARPRPESTPPELVEPTVEPLVPADDPPVEGDGSGRVGSSARHVWGFTRRVLRDFVRNKGLLLAGALGYNTLLSIIPLFALFVVVLSHLFDEQMLASTIATQAEVLLPGQGAAINHVFLAFVENRGVIGGVGVVVLLFFSTIAFRMLDDAIAIVFHRQARGRAPHPLRAFVLPLAYVGLIGLGIFGLTLVMVGFDALPSDGIRVLGVYVDANTAVPLVKLLAFVGLVVLLASFYGVMPMAKISWKRALVGGFIAATLWEAVRLLMMWYFASVSLVDVVYGSLGTVIVLLVGLEVAAIILLLGAQVIAELEHAAEHGRAWHEPPPPDPTWQ
jgi:membrane protein